jgi:ABC-type methionine transport system permease subunit
MLNLPLDRLLGSLGETLIMMAVSGAISFAVGLPLGLIHPAVRQLSCDA